MKFRKLAVCYLVAQAIGALLWWCLLFGWPESRTYFMAAKAPDSTLLAFVVADALFISTSAAAAYGIWTARRWAWPVLCFHSGAAVYAALYCWTLVALTGGDGLLGAVLMSPSLPIPGLLAWSLRPRDTDAC